jgi:hypothetical protein
MATRLRKTFKYPEDSSDDDGPHELDEIEQESLIEDLRDRNVAQNQLYTLAFTIVALLPTPVYIYQFLKPSSTAPFRFLTLLSISSLLLTAYDIYFRFPNSRRVDKGKKPLRNSDTSWWSPRRKEYFDLHVTLWNIYLAVGVLVLGFLKIFYDANYAFNWYIPAAIVAIGAVARQTMAEVDISSLEKLKYGYKGA